MEKSIPVKDKISPEKHIKAAPFRKGLGKTAPHRHKQYFEIVFLSKGKGAHWIDGIRYEVKPPILYFINEHQVHNWDLESEPEGYVIIIKKSFIEKSLDLELKMLLNRTGSIACLPIAENLTIQRIFELLAEENKEETDTNFPVIEGLLKALLAKIQEVSGNAISQSAKKADFYASFMALLNQGNPIKSKVAWYADLLNTTPQNLNAACRKAVDLPATGVLSDFVINEAKRQLFYTDKTVSEISFSLNFNDPSHFVKYFKRHCGQTPQSFRLNFPQIP